MRRLLAPALILAAAQGLAQTPPLPALSEEGAQPPAVRIRPDKRDRVEKAVVGGRTILRVTPRGGGRPYYLVEGVGGWERRDSLDDGTRVPMWTIYSFD
ncbi:MAG: DUF2782 domain-containing protein [Burkholderiales bacterium]